MTVRVMFAGATKMFPLDYEDGFDFQVKEGHLFVLDEAGNPFAVVAPGKWHGAVIQDEAHSASIPEE